MRLEEVESYASKLRELYVEHIRFTSMQQKLYAHMRIARPETVLLVTGPPRVGKSTVAKDIVAAIRSEFSDLYPGCHPVLLIEATNAIGGYFSTKHLTIRGLKELKHPILGDLGNPTADRSYRPRLNVSESELRIALEQALRFRQVIYVVVDEAHHCLITKGRHGNTHILDTLKCLTNTAKVVLVLVGAYKLLKEGLISTHFGGRLQVKHFRSYGSGPGDKKEFGRILDLMDRVLPVKPGATLYDMQEMIQEGSLGAIGRVFIWVEAALAELATEPAARYLSEAHFVSTRMLQKQRDELLAENALGEKLVTQYSSTQIDDDLKDVPLPPRGTARPFSRSLGRDPVG